jgi:hypothetical protein
VQQKVHGTSGTLDTARVSAVIPDRKSKTRHPCRTFHESAFMQLSRPPTITRSTGEKLPQPAPLPAPNPEKNRVSITP